MTTRIDKTTGTFKRTKSISEYEKVFEDLINYEKNNLGTDEFREIQTRLDLEKWLVGVVNAKGSATGRLAGKISQTRTYDKITRTKEESIKSEEIIRSAVTIDKEKAKRQKTIYQSRDKRGRVYFYDFSKKKRISKKEAGF